MALSAISAALALLTRVQLSAATEEIVTPSPAQLRYQSTDFIALIHFNMATFAHNGDPGCDKGNWDVKADYASGKTRDPATFNPKLLNVTQWFDSISALGANIAILTAKHGCGFALWPTRARLPDGSAYGYSVGAPGAAIRGDVIRQFVDAARAAGVGYGFYYSIMKNFLLCHGFTGASSCTTEVLPGQRNLSEEEYKGVVKQQVTELWTQYGNLTRIWVDSGLGGFGDLMNTLQPQAAGTPRNPTGWCGTESGHPSHDVGPGDVWSPGGGYFGSPEGTQWVPKFCDPQLFQDHVWFWEPNLSVRTLDMLIPVYHDIVGRGMVLELAFSIDRDGLVEESHAKAYRELGDWVRSCYGSPVKAASGAGGLLLLEMQDGDVFDRFQLQEDIVLGQRVRNYTIEIATGGGAWGPLASGSAIGMKRIHLLPAPVTVTKKTQVRFRVSHAIATPQLRFFGAYKPCATGARGEADVVLV